MVLRSAVLSLLMGVGFAVPSHSEPVPAGMVAIQAGTYTPLYRGVAKDSVAVLSELGAQPISVPGFLLDERPVTNAEYLAFVYEHPEWRRSNVKPLFADDGYLRHWAGDLDIGDPVQAESPVVNVSWFAARAYCAAQGKRLPTVDEWEYVGAASETKRDATDDEAFQSMLRTWYARPTRDVLPAAGSGMRNTYGVSDMHGLVWEWTRDFNSALISGESRGDAAIERQLYCGSGASGAADFRNYAAFMRYAFRSSLEARYTVSSLGFRAARNLQEATLP